MPFSAKVIRIKDHNEDHEVGGQDLPVVVTLATAPQHTAPQLRGLCRIKRGGSRRQVDCDL
jgi:hypothetical protein